MSTSYALPLHIVTLPCACAEGSQVPLVMLHGWGHSLESLRPLAELLAEDRRVYLVDLPGFGASPLPPSEGEAWGTREYAECVRQSLLGLGLPKVVLFGTSFGGRVALRLASQYPEMLEGVVLLNSHGLLRTFSVAKRLRILGIRWLRSLVKAIDSVGGTNLFVQWFVPRFASADYRSSGPLRATLVKTVNEDQSPSVTGIEVPVFLLWGEKDTEAPVEFCERFYQLIPGAKSARGGKQVIPLAGHLFYLGAGSYLAASFIAPWLRSLHRAGEGVVQC